MGEWVTWILGSVCAAIAVLQGVGLVWVLIELHRKWRTAPPLWGLDWLDVVYRVDREFGLVLTGVDFDGWTPETRAELTAGQLWELVASKLRARSVEVPADGWDRVVALLAEALNVKASRIVPESRLCADLGMKYDLGLQ